MKRVPLALSFALVLVSCASAPPQYTSTVEDSYKDGAVTVSFEGLAPAGSSSPQGLTVQVENGSASPITVKWDRSTLTLDGESQTIFLEGQGSSEVMIPAASRLSATVYPSNNVSSAAGAYGSRTTVISPLKAREIALALCVEVTGEDRFYTIKLSQEAPAPAPSPGAHMSNH